MPHVPPALFRLAVRPDEPDEGPPAIAGRRHGRRQPYADSTVQSVRRLIEQTTLSQQQIADRVGVKRATVSVWQKNYGWTRPAFAPRCPSTVPLWRAGPRLKLRLLTGRLVAIAERMVRELEDNPDTDLDRLAQALQVVRMARTTAIGNTKRRLALLSEPRTGSQEIAEGKALRTALKELRRGGVDLDRAPQEALDLVIDANRPIEPDHPALRPRGKRRR